MTRGLGYRRSPPRPLGAKPDFSAAARLAALPPPPDHADNSHLVLSVLDQGGQSSCVAHATVQAVRAAQFRASGVPGPLPSRAFVYWVARAMSHQTGADAGTFVRDAFAAIVRFGLPPESAWPYVDDGASYAKMPGLEAFREADHQRQPTQYERINDFDDARIDAVKRALAAGFLVAFGTPVSERFCSNQLGTGPVGPPLSLPLAGGHAMAIVGYDFRGTSPHFVVVNSWGEQWGNWTTPGFWMMDPSYLTWAETDDLWICEQTPTFIGVAP